MKSYLKFLSRNKLYTAIEAVGLVVSLAFVILTGNYVVQQWEMTRNVPGYRDLYSIELGVAGMDTYVLGSIPDMALRAKEHVPDVELATSILYMNSSQGSTRVFTIDDKALPLSLYWVDRDFFDIFPFRFLEGTPDVLEDPSQAIICHSLANRLGQEKPVLGMSITTSDGDRYRIGAVMEDWDHTLFEQVDMVLPMTEKIRKDGTSALSFLKAKAGTNREDLQEKVGKAAVDPVLERVDISFLKGSRLVRYDELFFENEPGLKGGDRQLLRLMVLVTLILLFSAIFNYINLSVALSGKRVREMATRRILGADRKEIYRRFLLEALGFTALCFVAAWLLARALLPTINGLLNADVQIRLKWTLPGLGIGLGFLAALSLVQALIPATIATRFQPGDVVKGEWRVRSKRIFEKVFIALQNAFSVLLVAVAVVLQMQMSHMLNRPIGADVDDVFYLRVDPDISSPLLRDRLSRLTCVSRIGKSQGHPGDMTHYFSAGENGEMDSHALLVCDSTAFRIFRFHILQQFSEPVPGTVWIMESDLTRLGLGLHGEGAQETFGPKMMLGGILEDFVSTDVLHYDVSTTTQIRVEQAAYGDLVLETTGDHRQARKEIMDAYAGVCEELFDAYKEPRDADYIPAILEKRIAGERDKLRLVQIFMLLCLMLSVLGLVAMSAYYASENARSVAVRKVFGSTVREEVRRGVTGYLLLVLAGAAVAVPVAVWLCRRLLERYSYRITDYGWVFVVAVVLVLLVSFASVLWQTLKAARTDPAVELKKE